MIQKLSDLFVAVKQRPQRKFIVVSANDHHSIEAVGAAVKQELIQAVLIGDEKLIREICLEEGVDTASVTIINEPNDSKAAALAVDMINRGEGDVLMKGLISTDQFVKAILNKERGLMVPGQVLSHVTAIENPHYHKLMIASDVAVMPLPDFNQKVQLIGYLVATAKALGIELPKVAVIAPSEQLIPSLESSKDAAMLTKMNDRGQIKGCIVDGPLAVDVAIDPESARIKGLKGAVAGDADCLLFPNLDAANVFYKTNMKLAGAESAAMLVGARVPVVLTSRGDTSLTKQYSIALAALVSSK